MKFQNIRSDLFLFKLSDVVSIKLKETMLFTHKHNNSDCILFRPKCEKVKKFNST